MARSVPSTLVHSDARRQTRVRDMRREIAASESIEPCVNLLGGSAALLKIVKTVNVRRERVNEAAVATLEAERQAGRMLKDLRLAGGQRRGRSRTRSPTLERLGISPNKSSRWQRLAEVSEEDFRHYAASTIASGHIVSSDGLLRVWRRLYQKSKPSRRREKVVRSAGSAAIGGEASEILGELENHRQTLALLLQVEADSPRSELVLPIIEARYASRLLRDMGDHVRALTTLLAGGRGGT